MTSAVRVLRGAPDDVELAALIAGIAVGTMANGPDDTIHPASTHETASRRRWRDGAQRLRNPLTHGPDAWRWSTHD